MRNLLASLALVGNHPGAIWLKFERTFKPTNSIAGTTIAIKNERRDDDGRRFSVLDGKRSLGTYRGTVLGAIDVNGARYVVVKGDDGTTMTAIAVPMS